MSEPLGIGILGTGSISIRGMLPHLTMEDVQDRVRVTAVCDTAPGRAQAAAERFGVPSAYESYEEMLANPAVDAIGIATPIGLHYEQGVAAVEAGKHVYFNKTMTITVAEADDLIDRAARKGVKLVASPGQMLFRHNQRIRELIQEGALGRLAWTAVGAAFGAYHENESVRKGDDPLTNVDPSWYFRKPGGGPLYDMTVYGLHAMTGVLGPAKRVTALSGIGLKEREFRGQMVPCDTDDNTVMLLDFGNTLFGFVYGTFAGSPFAFGAPSYFGTLGAIEGNRLNGQPLEYPGIEVAREKGESALLPHVVGPHQGREEAHVYEDVMQL
ncbi:MAG TPA: Gfo/Idh/MocA family oxidoreductase, partial [Armatimonadota bacterium]